MNIFFLLSIVFFVVGAGGMAFIVYKKAPLLLVENISFVQAPKKDIVRRRLERALYVFQEKMSFEKMLRKALTRTKIRLLRWENQIDQYLQKLSKSKKFDKDFWEKFQKDKNNSHH